MGRKNYVGLKGNLQQKEQENPYRDNHRRPLGFTSDVIARNRAARFLLLIQVAGWLAFRKDTPHRAPLE